MKVSAPASARSGAGVPGTSTTAHDDDAQLWRMVDIYRAAALAYAAALVATAHDGYRRPLLAWTVLAVLAAWTAYVAVRRDRGRPALAVELVLAAGGVLLTRIADDPRNILDGAQSLPAVWPGAVVIGWAISVGVLGGVLAATVIAVAELIKLVSASVGSLDELAWAATWRPGHGVVLLFIAAVVVGSGVRVLRRARAEAAAAIAAGAAAAERERLAADIHDSVLQVLGLVSRAGAQLDGDAGRLARLAGEQEARLRALIAVRPAPPGAGAATVAGETVADLTAALAGYAGAGVTISGPADPVLLPAQVSGAVVAATGAALDNVRRHAGPGARAWLLVEDADDGVTVTVRDDGRGFAPGRLEEARREGRLGVAASVLGRIAAVGGRARVVGAPGQGAEVELWVPRRGL